jgi:hypothetical protein
MSELRTHVVAGTDDPCLPEHLRRPRLRRKLACEYLEIMFGITVAPSTLAKYACVGGGPDFQRINRTPLYPRQALDAWALEKLGPVVKTTSQALL